MTRQSQREPVCVLCGRAQKKIQQNNTLRDTPRDAQERRRGACAVIWPTLHRRIELDMLMGSVDFDKKVRLKVPTCCRPPTDPRTLTPRLTPSEPRCRCSRARRADCSRRSCPSPYRHCLPAPPPALGFGLGFGIGFGFGFGFYSGLKGLLHLLILVGREP